MTFSSHSRSTRALAGERRQDRLVPLRARPRRAAASCRSARASRRSTRRARRRSRSGRQTMTCPTFSTSTAYCSTDRQFRSVCTTTLATLRWTNSSPGSETDDLVGRHAAVRAADPQILGRLLLLQAREEVRVVLDHARSPEGVVLEQSRKYRHRCKHTTRVAGRRKCDGNFNRGGTEARRAT